MVAPRLSRSARDRKPVHLLDGLPGAKLMLRTAALGIAIAAFVAGMSRAEPRSWDSAARGLQGGAQ
jgi:hypothetical protein